MLVHIKLKKMFKFLNKNIKEFVIANINFNIFYLIIGYLISFDICNIISLRINVHLGVLLVFFITFVFAFLLFSKRAAIGVSENELVVMHLRIFKVESKKVYRIPLDNIRSITVSKFGPKVNLKLAFISDEGVFEKKKYGFSTFILGSVERKEYAKSVYKKLTEIQKVIDKGDF